MINLKDKENYYPNGLPDIDKDKKHAKLSASGSSKWLNCAGSVEAESKIPNKQSVYAEEGTLAHELADMCLQNYINSCALNNDYKSPLDRIGETVKCESDKKVISTVVTDEMAKFVQEYIDYVLAHETKNSQLYTEDRVDFSNIVPDGFGTMDAAILDYDTGICHIFDLKYGQGVPVDAVENTQAQLYALGFYNELKCLDVIKSFKIHIVQPRIFNYSSWEITLDDLIKFGEYASKKANEALTPNALRTPGEKQCKWCNAKATCPALKKHTEDTILSSFEDLNNRSLIITDDVGKKPEMILDGKSLNDEQLKLILDNKKLIEDFLKSVEQHVYDKLLDGEKFEGYKLVEGRSNRKWVDNAEEILKNKLGEDAYEKKLIGITAAGKKLKKDEVEELTYKPEGKLQLVLASDKRKEVTKTIDHFDKI
jgi:hypothetical protein